MFVNCGTDFMLSCILPFEHPDYRHIVDTVHILYVSLKFVQHGKHKNQEIQGKYPFISAAHL